MLTSAKLLLTNFLNRQYMNNIIKKISLWATVAFVAAGAVSCEDQPDKFELSSGLPVVKYVRVTDPEKSDSLLTGAYMDNLICLVGDNLTSIKEMYFNDQKAILNTSFITDHTLIVEVPGNIPEVVTNKIYMVTAGNDTVDYDFSVKVPAPTVRSMLCEFAKPGSEATIIGDYFIDDPNVPLTITMAGNVKVSNITSISKTRLSFIIPDDAIPGYVNVSTIYGSSRSSFQYMDTRCILFDWDGSHNGQTAGHGWRDASKVLRAPGDDPWEAIDGNYIRFAGDLSGETGASWAEDEFSFNYWPEPGAGYPALSDMPNLAQMLADYSMSELQIKFEVYIPSSNPWSSCALQMIFTGDEHVTFANATNAYISNSAIPRGLWLPWQLSGSYDTADQWTTIAIPMSNFNYSHDGAACATATDKKMMTGLTFFVWNGGIAGTDCSPIICIDNIRIVPIE